MQPEQANTKPYVVTGYIFAALSLLFFPIIFGPLGIVMGYLAHSKGNKHGKLVMIISVVTMIAGMILGYLMARARLGM